MKRSMIVGAALAAMVLTGSSWISMAVARTAEEASSKRTLTDQGITDKIELELAGDVVVPAYGVDVRTTDGVVTLSGPVKNLLAKERAQKIAEMVRGVRAVVNTIEVQPDGRSDGQIRADVESALLINPAADSYEVRTAVRDGVVTLTGRVESWHERDLAAKLAKGVRGVKNIDNQIDIAYTSTRPDREIAADVQSKLRWDRYVDDALIRVEVQEGTVRLSGTVGSVAERTRAETLAWTSGVESVDDSGLEVQYWARDEQLRTGKYVPKADDEIRRAVKDALLYDPRVSSFDIDVSAASGVVTLRGEVDSLEARRAAGATAGNTVGVFRVQNIVRVRPEKRMTDAAIAQKIRDALKRDAHVERYQVTTTVVGGVAYLSGEVDSHFEKAQAENVAAGVPGVVDVRNSLRVDYPTVPLAYSPYLYDWSPYDYAWWTYDLDGPTTVKKSDWVLEQEIKDELWWSPFVDANEVHVEVEDGVATLTGTVDTWAERNAAAENALEGGAIQVRNRLDVDYGPAS